MGNESSIPDGGETFKDEPNEFHPPTMEESRGAVKVSVPQQQADVSQRGLGRAALIARLKTHRHHQNNADAANAAILDGENGDVPYAYPQQQVPATPPRPGGQAQSPLHAYEQTAQRVSPEHRYHHQQQQQHGRAAGQNPQHLQQSASSSSAPPPGGIEVPLMYSASDTGRNASFIKRNLKTTAQKSKQGLINSMRNLSMKTAGLKTKGGDQAADWERQWDEDEESSEEEDDEDALQEVTAVSTAHVHKPLRPGMDGGHSSSIAAPVKRAAADQLAVKAAPELVPTTEEDVLAKKADMAMQQGENAVQWDTAANEAGKLEEQVYEKPNMEMFLPMLRVLGKGSFGKVVLVQKRVGKERGGLFAMKILRKSHLVKRRQIERTKTERKVLSVVDHPFIMKLHFAFQTEDKLYLVLDYCPGGELFFHLSRFRRFPERVARFYAAELLLAIGHLHKRGIIYRDLKPENVLLDADGHVKLGDFGLAKDRIRHPWEGATSMCGTPEYMAPEVLSQSGHGFCVDYWGLGMLVYEMMTGLPPWYTTDRAKLFRRLKSAPLEIPSYFSPHAGAYVSALLERNPRRRLGVTGIRGAMEHEFFRSINWRALYAKRVESPIRPCEGWKAPEATDGSMSAPIDANGPEKMSNAAIDVAVANFDNTFTRMPVNTEDGGAHDTQHSDEGDGEELHEDTFIGFTFDDYDDNDLLKHSSKSRQRSTRQLD